MSTLTANSSGEISGHLTVPPNITAGHKLVEFVGAGGSYGSAIYLGSNILETVRTEFREQVTHPRCDPVAQTFMLNADTLCSGIRLWFQALGTTDIVVSIRDTGNGVPAQTILAEKQLPVSACNTTTFTQFNFDFPFMLSANQEYALVVMCNDATSAVKIATLGQFDVINQKWVTSQPYSVGVMLTSSNASTWSAQQLSDLAFEILAPVFTQTTKTVDLGHITVTAITDLMVFADTYLPSPDCQIDFTLTYVGSGDTITCEANQPINLASAYSGQINIQANLKGTVNYAPVLGDGITIATGVLDNTGIYVSRLFDCNNVGGANSTDTVVILNALTPGTSTFNVHIRTSSDSVWIELTGPTTMLLDDGYTEYTFSKSSLNLPNTRLKVTLTGTPPYRPIIKSLRCAMLKL